MPAATTIAVIGAVIAAGATAYSVKSSNDARDEAEEKADKDAKAQQAAADELAKKEAGEKQKLASLQLRSQGTGTSRSNTINTAALGGTGSGGGKSLLGL